MHIYSLGSIFSFMMNRKNFRIVLLAFILTLD